MASILALCLLFWSPSYGAAKNDGKFTVVIDAGHGGHDHGAIDNGAREKDINLGVAKKLASLIKKKSKNINVVMTRDDDTFISLQERANIANRNKGDLFISIHTNSVDKSNPNRTKVSGTSVYALGPQKDANNLKVAQRENSVIELEDNYHQKYSGFDPSKNESYIIFEMAQKRNLSQSLRFADKAQKELVGTAERADRGVKQAGFWVLWATSMPSVLVELDFICNPETANFLNSNEGQEKLAQALYNAIVKYVSAKDSSTAAVSGSSVSTVAQNTAISVKQTPTDESSSVTAMVLPEEKPKEARVHMPLQKNSNPNLPRRRRSSKSKELSNRRNLETESIILTDENSYLAIESETPEEENKTIMTASGKESETNKDKKSKTPKKKVKKSNIEKKSIEKPKSLSDNVQKVSVKGNTKTFTVSNSPSPAALAQGEKVYKILLTTSETELNVNDPRFCGLSPIEMFRENDQYKYTYGSSTNRREIESKLLELKSYIPEAAIVVRAQ